MSACTRRLTMASNYWCLESSVLCLVGYICKQLARTSDPLYWLLGIVLTSNVDIQAANELQLNYLIYIFYHIKRWLPTPSHWIRSLCLCSQYHLPVQQLLLRPSPPCVGGINFNSSKTKTEGNDFEMPIKSRDKAKCLFIPQLLRNFETVALKTWILKSLLLWLLSFCQAIKIYLWPKLGHFQLYVILTWCIFNFERFRYMATDCYRLQASCIGYPQHRGRLHRVLVGCCRNGGRELVATRDDWWVWFCNFSWQYKCTRWIQNITS